MAKQKISVRSTVAPGLFVAPKASTRVTSLVNELNDIREQLKALNDRKDEVSARLTKRYRAEAAADEKGKLRLQTEDSTMVLVEAANRHIDGKKLLVLGVKASVIEQATKVTPYEYVSVSKKKDTDDAAD